MAFAFEIKKKSQPNRQPIKKPLAKHLIYKGLSRKDVASLGIEPKSRAPETLILSIVLRGLKRPRK